LIIASCNSNDYIIGNERTTSIERELPPFQKLDIQGNYEVMLHKSPNSSLIIETDENLIHLIRTEVENDTLKIYNKDKIKSKSNIKIYISYQKVNEINVGGASSIKSEMPLQTENLKLTMNGTGFMEFELEAETLELNLSGTGMINLSGKVEKEALHLSGAGNFNAYNLKSKECYIVLSGIGSAHIYVENNLNAQISGVGGIKYKGNPTSVNREIAGIGTINKVND
jgi:hypothetical protein